MSGRPIDPSYEDAFGTVRNVDPAVVRQLEAFFDDETDDATAGPLIVRPGADIPTGTLTLETGETMNVGGRLTPDVPLGYHRLTVADIERTLIVTPGKCHLPEGWRAWGWACQLYATRSEQSWGMGDLGDLDRVARWAAQAGAGFVMINPLHAAAPGRPQEASPYSPTSRRFRNPLYLDVAAIAGQLGGGGSIDIDIEGLAAAGRALNSSRRIERDRVLDVKFAALEMLWDSGFRDRSRSAHDGLNAEELRSLREFATWTTIAEAHGSNWNTWPSQLRRPDDPGVAEFAAINDDRIRFHMWLQHVLSSQLDTAAENLAVVQDLPIGFHPTGADAWSWQDLVATGVSVGAPPDLLNTRGQDWGLPPFIPSRLRAADYRPFIETIRATMPAGGGLRVDHVMGLFRLWWIPQGNEPGAGAFVRYPSDDLLDILALESVRHGAVVVGEDLGTVEAAARVGLDEHDVLSYRLLWFEEALPPTWPAKSMAAITTHDLPTVAGLWTGHDVEHQQSLELPTNVEELNAMRDRLRLNAAIEHEAPGEIAVELAHELLGTAPSVMLCATLDDACGALERPNIPGADHVRDNWSIALPFTIEQLTESELAATIARGLNRAVEQP